MEIKRTDILYVRGVHGRMIQAQAVGKPHKVDGHLEVPAYYVVDGKPVRGSFKFDDIARVFDRDEFRKYKAEATAKNSK